jgi:hypothetical protein
VKLSELDILPPHPVISVTNIYIDGQPYELADDGDTLLKVETIEQSNILEGWLTDEN